MNFREQIQFTPQHCPWGLPSAAASKGVREEMGLWEWSVRPAPLGNQVSSRGLTSPLWVEVETLPLLGGQEHWLQVLSFLCSTDFLSWVGTIFGDHMCSPLPNSSFLRTKSHFLPQKVQLWCPFFSFFLLFPHPFLLLILRSYRYFSDCWCLLFYWLLTRLPPVTDFIVQMLCQVLYHLLILYTPPVIL